MYRFPFFGYSTYLIYSDKKHLHCDFFQALLLQVSARETLNFRFSKWLVKLPAPFYRWFKQSVDLPKDIKECIAIIKPDKIVVFEMSNGKPIRVWRQKASGWVNEPFLGVQLIEEYSIDYFKAKQKLIVQILINQLLQNRKQQTGEVHGDFTHFNILISGNGDVEVIDDKKHVNSPLFDVFYFWVYLRSRIDCNKRIAESEKRMMGTLLDNLLLDIYRLHGNEKELKSIHIPSFCSLLYKDIQQELTAFQNLLMKE